MKTPNKNLLLGAVAVAVLVGLGAVAQGSRAADVEVAYGFFTCSGQPSIFQVNSALEFNGTAGIIQNSDGLSLTQIFDVTGDANEACETLATNLDIGVREEGCSAGPLRLIGNREELAFVCTGDKNRVNTIIGVVSELLLESNL